MNKTIQQRLWGAVIILATATLILGCQTKIKLSQTPPAPIQEATDDKGSISPNLPTAGILPSELKGKSIFEESCATCHGINGKGNGDPHKDLTQETVMRKKRLTDIFAAISGRGEHGQISAHVQIPAKLSVLDRWSAIMYLRTFYAKPPVGDTTFEQLFGRNCATCHGKRGYGDGPVTHGDVLVPKPANFTSLERMFKRSDAEIFEVISRGAYPSAMPPWQDVEGMKDPKARWQFVDFVRTFSYKPAKIEMEEK